MLTMDMQVRRISIVSSRPFDAVVERLTSSIGRPDMRAFHAALVAADSAADLETVVRDAVGTSGLMEFARFDAGEVVRTMHGGAGPRLLRLVVGNPLIMQQMAATVPDAASYAPVTILIDERSDGVHVSYDLFASLLAAYGDGQAIAVAAALDAQIEALLEAAAGSSVAATGSAGDPGETAEGRRCGEPRADGAYGAPGSPAT